MRDSILAALCLAGVLAAGTAPAAFDTPGNFNPIVPGYFADPTIKKFDGLYYLYATTDGNGGGRGPATVWVSANFVDWTLVPMNWPSTPFYWAPDVVKRPDGRYYLFYNQPCNTYAGVSSSPRGPWTPVTSGDGLVIKDRLVKDVITLDTQLFEDKDGTLYGYWGTWGIYAKSGCGFGVFNPDMKSFSRLGMIPNTQAKDFFEAPFMIERNGVYYFTYSSGSCHDASYRVQYAVGPKPDGQFTMGPNNPILATSADGTIHGPGHHSILQEGGEFFIVYHRHDIPVTPNGMHRQTCADRLVFDGDGGIRKVEPSHQGVGRLGPGPAQANLAFTQTVSASSFYTDTLRRHAYKPEYAVDDNNATLWRPADNRPGHWLSVDLGAVRRVQRTLTQFEYATWYYQYLIEASADGQAWSVFADRRASTRWGSPMADTGDVQARYLRITITGTEIPGLFGAIWNFKAFSEAPADPLLAMATQAFDELGASRQPARAAQPGVARLAAGAPAVPELLIRLDAADFQLGTLVAAWTNRGALGGEFRSLDAKPVTSMAGGRKSVRFSGKQALRASFPAPRALAGSSSFTVAAWVNNPEVAESECLVSWAGRGGPDGATAQVGYGTHNGWGAVGHWGHADMGFRGGPPKAGQWHHLAVVYDGVVERLYVDGRLDHAAAKMLLMHEGRPVYVGASEPGSEFFDGYLASLRLYSGAMSEAEVVRLAGDAPAADVLVHLDSAKLDYGPLVRWDNSGSLGGAFAGGARPPVVEDVHGRIAARFEPGQSMELSLGTETALGDFTLLATVANPSAEPGECVVELAGAGGERVPLLVAPPAGQWQQVAVVFRGGTGACYVNGARAALAAPSAPKGFRGVRLGGQAPFSGALSRAQLFGRALSEEEIAQLHTVWKSELPASAPSPAVFERAPAAATPAAVFMTARRARSEAGGVEYRFAEASGRSSGWIAAPFWLDDPAPLNTRCQYTVKTRDALGNVSAASAPAAATAGASQFEEFTDRFDVARDYLAQGTAASGWDGFLTAQDQSAPEAAAAREGVLRLQSKGTVWDGGKPLGPFLFKQAAGDFVMQVKVADYAGLAARRAPGNNDGGLMARVGGLEEAGPGEDLVQLNFFPIWNQGNMVTSLDGGRSQKGNGLGWNAHRHLQIIRQGPLFLFRTSPDGAHWVHMPGSPVERRDMDGLPLQAGLYHASYGAESSHVAFSDFHLWTRKPVP